MEYAEIVTVASRALARAGTPAMELPDVADADLRWGRSTVRQRIVAMIDHFVLLAEEFDGFASLADAASRLGRRLRGRWPAEDCEMGSYPAFGPDG